MLNRGMRKQEIEEFLEGKDTFVQIDHLTRYIKENPPIEMRKFAYLKMAQIYLNHSMFVDAAKMFSSAAVNCLTFKEQQDNYIKEAKSYVKAQKFEDAQNSLKKAFADASAESRRKMYDELIVFYKKEGESLEKNGLKGKATKLYERLIRMKLTKEDKSIVKERLLDLYKKLGKIKEYNFLQSIGEF